MKYRTLGRTGYTVSEIGYGAWGIGKALWKGAEDAESLRALHRAVDLGLTFIDTALVYGDGHSESLVAQLVKERSEHLIVATKVPPKNNRWPARPATQLAETFPYDHIIKCAETSLRNLKCDTIDLLQFHVWIDDWAGLQEWKDAVAQLKADGKIRHFGISINDHQPESVLAVAKTGLVDSFQVIYNIFDQSPEKDLFPLCQKENIGVIVRVPLDEGGLTGSITPESKFEEGDFRANYFRGERKKEVYDRVEKLKTLLGTEASSVAELALRFCLAHPAVSTVIPGMRSVKNVERNCAVSDGRTLSKNMIAALRGHAWPRNFYHAG